MSDIEYPSCINELYHSEVLGEQVSLALLPVARNTRDEYHFGTFLQLESETKVRLRPFLKKYDLEFVESTEPSDLVNGIVTVYQQGSWLDFLAALKPVVDQYIARFKEIAAAGPREDQEMLQSMVTHEQCFAHWIEREVAGGQGSLDAVISLLQHPLPALEPDQASTSGESNERRRAQYTVGGTLGGHDRSAIQRRCNASVYPRN